MMMEEKKERTEKKETGEEAIRLSSRGEDFQLKAIYTGCAVKTCSQDDTARLSDSCFSAGGERQKKISVTTYMQRKGMLYSAYFGFLKYTVYLAQKKQMFL